MWYGLLGTEADSMDMTTILWDFASLMSGDKSSLSQLGSQSAAT